MADAYEKALAQLATICAIKPTKIVLQVEDWVRMLKMTLDGKKVMVEEMNRLARWVNDECPFAPDGSRLLTQLRRIRTEAERNLPKKVWLELPQSVRENPKGPHILHSVIEGSDEHRRVLAELAEIRRLAFDPAKVERGRQLHRSLVDKRLNTIDRGLVRVDEVGA